MNVDRGHGDEKRDTLLCPGFGMLNAVMVKNAVVYTFRSSAHLHFFLEEIASPGDSGKEPFIPVRLGVNNSSVKRRGAVRTGFVSREFVQNPGTAPLDAAAVFFAEAVINHRLSGRTDGGSVPVQRKMLRIFKGGAALEVKRNNGIDIPGIEKMISCIIISSAVVNESVDGKVRMKIPEFGYGNDGGDGIVSAC